MLHLGQLEEFVVNFEKKIFYHAETCLKPSNISWLCRTISAGLCTWTANPAAAVIEKSDVFLGLKIFVFICLAAAVNTESGAGS